METMQILTAEEMSACDRLTSEQFGVSMSRLMLAAGRAVALFARRCFPGRKRILVLCGRGHNGGDGMVAARELALAGNNVSLVLLGEEAGLRAEVRDCWNGLASTPGVVVSVCRTPEELGELLASKRDVDLIVDAIVGTGLQAALRGLPAMAVDWLGRANAPVLAVDLPSGWNADATSAEEAAPADAVVTFTAPKLAHALGSGLTRRWSDPVIVAPIGSPREAVRSQTQLHWTGTAKSLFEAPRAANAHKGSFGHVLVAGGSAGKTGAVAMAAMAAMRTGAGLVTAAAPAALLHSVAGFAPEMMSLPLESDAAALLERKTVLAIGPGMGTSDAARQIFWELLEACTVPVVIDADGLNLLAQQMSRISSKMAGKQWILTPHPGEMARLAGIGVAELEANRLATARSFARQYQVTLILKGHRTLVAHPDGSVAVNTTGNPGMAKGGSGDVLTGMVAAALAQFPARPKDAVEAAVHLHGLAGDFAAAQWGEHSMLATDMLQCLPAAIRLRDADGWTWLQGAAQDAIRHKQDASLRKENRQ